MISQNFRQRQLSFTTTSNMNFHLIFVTYFAALVAIPQPVLAQPPCPPPFPPGLEDVVNSAEKCACFYSLLGSGLDLGDSSTFSTVFTDDSVQSVAQTGQYVGVDGISEYLTFVKGGENGFVKDYILINAPLFLDMTGTTTQQCVATIAERRQLPFNSIFLQDNQDLCVDIVAGSTLTYTMTGDPTAPITVQTVNAWAPDELISGTFGLFVNTAATADFVCDAIVNSCGFDDSRRSLNTSRRLSNSKTSKSSKVSKTPPNAMEKCLENYNALPATTSKAGKLTYIDGNSKGCRILHGVFAKSNSDHCPHISFEADEDVNGLVKCIKSKEGLLTGPTGLFTEQQLELFMHASTILGLGPTGIDIQMQACPEPQP